MMNSDANVKWPPRDLSHEDNKRWEEEEEEEEEGEGEHLVVGGAQKGIVILTEAEDQEEHATISSSNNSNILISIQQCCQVQVPFCPSKSSLKNPLHDDYLLLNICSFLSVNDRSEVLNSLCIVDKVTNCVVENSCIVWKSMIKSICKCERCIENLITFENFSLANQIKFWKRAYYLTKCQQRIKRQGSSFLSFGIYYKKILLQLEPNSGPISDDTQSHISQYSCHDENMFNYNYSCMAKQLKCVNQQQKEVLELLKLHFENELGNHLAPRRQKECRFHHNKKIKFEIINCESIPDPLSNLNLSFAMRFASSTAIPLDQTVRRGILSKFIDIIKNKMPKILRHDTEACKNPTSEVLGLCNDLRASLGYMSTNFSSIKLQRDNPCICNKCSSCSSSCGSGQHQHGRAHLSRKPANEDIEIDIDNNIHWFQVEIRYDFKPESLTFESVITTIVGIQYNLQVSTNQSNGDLGVIISAMSLR